MLGLDPTLVDTLDFMGSVRQKLWCEAPNFFFKNRQNMV